MIFRRPVGASGQSRAARALLPAMVLATGAFAVYVRFPSATHEYDAFSFARTVSNGGPAYKLFHPHHLLYPSAGLAWHRITGHRAGAMRSLQELNAVLGGAGIGAMYLAALAGSGSPWAAGAAAAGLAGSYAYWNSASEASARLVGCLWLIVAAGAALLVSGRGPVWWALPGTGLGLAALGHQTNILLSPALLVAAMVQPGMSWRRRAGSAAVMLLVGAGVSVAGYAVVGKGIIGIRTWAGVARWTTAYLQMNRGAGSLAGLAGNPFSGRTFPSPAMTRFERARFGWRRAFYGPRDRHRPVLLSIKGGSLARWLLWGGAVAAAGLLLIPAAGGRGLVRPAAVGAVWLAGFVPFFYWWEPGNLQFWVSSLPAAWLLFAVAAAAVERTAPAGRLRAVARACFVGFALALGWANFQGKVVLDADPEHSFYGRLAADLHGSRGSGDVLLIGGWNAVPFYLEDHAGEPFLSARAVLEEAEGGSTAPMIPLQRRLDEAVRRGRVLCLHEILDPGRVGFGFLEHRFGVTPEAWRALVNRYEVRKVAGRPEEGVYLLERRRP